MILPRRFPRKTLQLLRCYLERRTCDIHGAKMPEYRPTIVMDLSRKPNRQFLPGEWGVCYARGTAPKRHDRVDEFGFCFTRLSDKDQWLIINDFLMDKKEEEWEIWAKSSLKRLNVPKEVFENLIILAWLKLLFQVRKAGLV